MQLGGVESIGNIIMTAVVSGSVIGGVMFAVLKTKFVTKKEKIDCQNGLCGKIDGVKVSIDNYAKVQISVDKEYAEDKKTIAVALTAIAGKMGISVEVP